MVKSAVINSFFATIGSQNEIVRRHEGSTYKNYLTNQNVCTFAFHLINNNATLRIITRCTRGVCVVFSRARMRSSNSARMNKSNFTTEKIV